MATKKNTSQTIETSLKRLESIVQTLEVGEIPLAQAIDLYEEGIQLSKVCIEILQKSELRIKKMKKDADGKLTLTDFEKEGN
jgi:exodeoxyribonuclease VII small subunit